MRRYKLLFICLTLLFCLHLTPLSSLLTSPLYSQVDTAWVRRYNGPGNGQDGANALAIDRQGNVYVTGYSTGSGSNTDYVTIKYNSFGVQQWVARFNGAGNSSDKATAIAVDELGNVYVTGSSFGINSHYDYATIKYNSNGIQQWIARYNGPGNDTDYARCIAIDGQGNVYVTGVSRSVNFDFDYATIKYNSAGVERWVLRYNGGPYWFWYGAFDLTIGRQNNIYVTGTTNQADRTQMTTIRYYPNGDTAWVRSYFPMTRVGYSRSYALTLDDSANVYVTGTFNHGMDHMDFLMIKYNSNGDTIWTNAQCRGLSGLLIWSGNDIVVDNSHYIYVTGSYNMPVIKFYPNGRDTMWCRYQSYNPGTGKAIALDNIGNVYVTGYSYGSGTSDDYTTIKYNSAGVQEWVARYNGPGNDDDYANAIAVDEQGNIYVTGYSYGSVTSYDYATIKYVQVPGIEEENHLSLSVDRLSLEVFPNPAKILTAIRYSLTAKTNVLLQLYDISGKLVKTLVNERKSAGEYSVIWNGADDKGRKVGEGVYFCILKTDGKSLQKKIMVVK